MSFNSVSKSLTIPISLHVPGTATNWTKTYSSGLEYYYKSANDETGSYAIPISIPRSLEAKGIKITKVELPVRVAVANLDADMAPKLYRQNMLAVAGASVDITATEITSTNDFNAATTFDANDRLLTLTVTTPADDLAVQAKCSYSLEIPAINAAAGTTIRIYPAIVYYEELT